MFIACEGLTKYSRQQIEKSRHKYSNYLLLYLQNKHGHSLGTKKFADSMLTIPLLYRQAQFNYTFYSYKSFVLNDCNPSLLFNDCMKNH